MKTQYLSMLAAVIAVLSSCAKDGEPGQDGINGLNGTNGGSNLKTIKVTVAAADWLPAGIPGVNYALNYDIQVPDLDQDVIDHGSVMVYLQKNGYDYPLPITVRDNYSYAATNGMVKLKATTDGNISFSVTSDLTFKIVTMRGS